MKLTKKPEKSRTGMAVTGPTKVATWGAQPPERGSPNLLLGPPRHLPLQPGYLRAPLLTCSEVEAAPMRSPRD